MDEEVDLREYVLALGRHWGLIVGALVIAVVVALVGYVLWPKKYEAVAVVGVTKPRYTLTFDTRVLSAPETGSDLPLGVQTSKAYTILASNDDLISEVITSTGARLDPSERNPRELRRMMHITGDSGILEFACENPSPQRASLVANAWAEAYVKQLNDTFSVTADNSAVLTKELADSEKSVETAEANRVAFLSDNPVSYLESQLVAAKQAMSDRLALADRLTMIQGDANALRQRLASQDVTMPTLGSQLHSLFLEATAFGPEVSLPVQIQVPMQAETSSMSATQLSEYMDGFIVSLRSRQEEVRGQAAESAALVTSLEKQLETVQGEQDRLTALQDVAQQTYASLAAKVDENRVTQAIQEPEVRLVSRAAMPTDPKRIELPMLLALAIAGGLLVGIVSALVVEFLRPAQR